MLLPCLLTTNYSQIPHCCLYSSGYHYLPLQLHQGTRDFIKILHCRGPPSLSQSCYLRRPWWKRSRWGSREALLAESVPWWLAALRQSWWRWASSIPRTAIHCKYPSLCLSHRGWQANITLTKGQRVRRKTNFLQNKVEEYGNKTSIYLLILVTTFPIHGIFLDSPYVECLWLLTRLLQHFSFRML